MILKNKEEVQLHFKQLQDAIEKENIPVFFQEPILEKQTKYKTSFSVNIDLKADKKLIIPILKKYGFILEDNKIIYVGEIPAKIIIENNLTLEEYLINFQAVLYLNKKKGMTSFDVVNEISNLFGFKRVGHTGTLDPLAEGVLLVTINKATKIGELLTAEDKEYIAEVELGYETDTYDSTGTITKEKEIPKTINLEQTLNSFKKTYLQEVPIYSAIKVNGKKLCGILSETITQNGHVTSIVLGAGVNIAQKDLSHVGQPAISLSELGVKINKQDFLQNILELFFQSYSAVISEGFGVIRQAYRERFPFIGKSR